MKKRAAWWSVLPILALVALITTWLFRPIVLNISTQLLDWNDYPLMVWIIDQHIDHWSTGSWGAMFQSNMFYPFADSLLFSDLLLPSAFLTGVTSLFVPDRIIAFNIVFLGTWLLNAVAAWTMWRKLWSGSQLFLATVFTTFMPFAVINIAHFQMITLWPFLFGFGYLLEHRKNWQQAVWIGLWTSITFVSSVYLAIFLMYCVGVWLLVQLAAELKTIWKNSGVWLLWIGCFVITVGLLAGPFAYKYYSMRQSYGAQRAYNEYVTYSAGVLDYFSSASYFSIASNLSPVRYWNSMIATGAGGFFPGFVLLGLAVLNVVIFSREKPHQVGIGLAANRRTVFFAILLISGVLFSFGPRLKVGSVYVGPPLPYAVLLKFVPLFEPVRATARWTLLASLAIIFFASSGFGVVLTRYKNQRFQWFLVATLIALYLVEMLPINRPIVHPNEAQRIEGHLTTMCAGRSVMLEYPVTYNPYGDHRGIIDMLQHWTGMILDATAHECQVINGYSGFSPTEHSEYDAQVSGALQRADVAGFDLALQKRGVQLFRVHTEKLTATESATVAEWVLLTVPEQVFASKREAVYAVR